MKRYAHFSFLAKQMTLAAIICVLMVGMGVFVIWGLGYLTSVEEQFQRSIYDKQDEQPKTQARQ